MGPVRYKLSFQSVYPLLSERTTTLESDNRECDREKKNTTAMLSRILKTTV